MECFFHDTIHLAKRAKERGFTVEEATLAIEQPTTIIKTPPRRGNHGGMIWMFFRSVRNKVLIVVAEIKHNECWPITGYWHN